MKKYEWPKGQLSLLHAVRRLGDVLNTEVAESRRAGNRQDAGRAPLRRASSIDKLTTYSTKEATKVSLWPTSRNC